MPVKYPFLLITLLLQGMMMSTPLTAQNAAGRETSYVDHSVLSTGTWFKLAVTDAGVYKIDYDLLSTIGVDPATVDPAKLGVYGNYTGMLPEVNYGTVVTDLQENAVYRMGLDDGHFNQGDALLFYAEGPVVSKYNIFERRYNHQVNLYSDTVYYFLTTDQSSGEAMQVLPNSTLTPTLTVEQYMDMDYHEADLVNLISSGKDWFGENFSGDTTERSLVFEFPDLYQEFPVHLKVSMAARAFVYTYFDVQVNGTTVIDSTLFLKTTPASNTYAVVASKAQSFFVDSDRLTVTIRYFSEDPTANAWLDQLELNVMRNVVRQDGMQWIRQPDAAMSGEIARFNLENVSSPLEVWAITDSHNPSKVTTSTSNNILSFTLDDANEQDFVVFAMEDVRQPVEVTPVDNQDLHGVRDVDFVIITHPMFMEQALRVAEFHALADQFNTLVVTPEQVYNEFSSGSQDVSAIRNFMRMLYNREDFRQEYGYLMLFGDASFDYKHRIHENTNLVPTYESAESFSSTNSFVTDDYFGLLDEFEGGGAGGILDLGIGRFPVSDTAQANAVVAKLEHYLFAKPQVSGLWQTQLCFVADDQDNNLHLQQAEDLTFIADTLNDGIRLNKIYSDAFQYEETSAGDRYPDVNVAINNQVEKGAVILNYTGHGGLIGWSDEVILDVPAITGYKNMDNMPLFITATCEFSRFDDPEFVSAGEYLFLNPHGGAIALMTTTRLAYAHSNIIVNTRIYDNLFKPVNGGRPRLGDLMRVSKNPSNANYLNFTLLGDPALRLAFPENDVVTTLISNPDSGTAVDTVKALSKVHVEGQVRDGSGIMPDFNGYVYPVVYDKKVTYTTLGNLGSSFPEDFKLFDRVLYQGKVTVDHGNFAFDFLMPKDISYSFGHGRISYYALDTLTYKDAWGGYTDLIMGGVNAEAPVDLQGPDQWLYLNTPEFVTGSNVTSHSVFYARIFDESGISVTGNGVGRDLVMVLDEDDKNAVVLNDYFYIDSDTYQQGIVKFPLENLSQGFHTLSLKAWDLQNNSSTASITFYVDDSAAVSLNSVFNYPNPFSESTRFVFRHNKLGVELDVLISIFDMQGRMVCQLDHKASGNDGSMITIDWDGRDSNGSPLDDGLYLYELQVTDPSGHQMVIRQKLLKSS